MNDSSTLDFKTILSEWKQFQHNKLKSNKIRCNFSARLNGALHTFVQNFTLTFITEPGEPRLLLHREESGLELTISLTDLNGYNTEGGAIELIVNPERNLGVVTLEFATEAVHELALAQLEAFTREIVLLPTPPPSSSSENE